MEVEKTIETKHGTFHFRSYNDKDEDKVIELWEAAFLTKMDRKVWRWKFHNKPFGRQIMLCFTEEGLPIAMYAGIPFHANFNGQDIKMTQLIDNMSHPDYRQATNGRKGLFIQNAEHFFDVYGGFNYGFSGKKHFRLGNIFLGYSMVTDGGVYLYANINKLKNRILPFFGSVNTISVATEDFDKLWEGAKPYYPFSVKRNRKFIQWRFFEHPNHKYTIYAYKNMMGKMLAYAVVSVKDNAATIVDVFALPHNRIIRALLQKISKNLLAKGIPTMQIWISKKHFITECLIQLGFEVKEEPLGIVPAGVSFDKKLDIDFAIKNIYYTMGDGDLF
ncbi:MAG: GNAT family N-acetyltransferase [Bacteroidota bacterium]|nr:GNAT family N-acetyltransferase [Bacteroidota bacterium]